MPTREEKNKFSEQILRRMVDLDIDCLDAIVSHCEEVGIEMEVAASLVNESLKSHLESQFQELNLLDKPNTLTYE